MKSEIIKLPGNLNPISHNYEPNSYVIQTKVTKSLIDMIKGILSLKGIYLLGRFSEWEYYNMDKAIEAALRLKKQINTELPAV
jgi:UDP-galactopyranose mutase